MNVTFRCPACEHTVSVDAPLESREIVCPDCQAARTVSEDAVRDGKLRRCVICPCEDVFVRKDFSQVLGVTCVVVGFVISSVFWYFRLPLWAYAVLFATAVIDFALYLLCGNLLECYRCKTQVRGVPGLENYEPFELETHEKHRQREARLKQAEASSR